MYEPAPKSLDYFLKKYWDNSKCKSTGILTETQMQNNSKIEMLPLDDFNPQRIVNETLNSMNKKGKD